MQINIPESLISALEEVARQELRTPENQALWFVSNALKLYVMPEKRYAIASPSKESSSDDNNNKKKTYNENYLIKKKRVAEITVSKFLDLDLVSIDPNVLRMFLTLKRAPRRFSMAHFNFAASSADFIIAKSICQVLTRKKYLSIDKRFFVKEFGFKEQFDKFERECARIGTCQKL